MVFNILFILFQQLSECIMLSQVLNAHQFSTGE